MKKSTIQDVANRAGVSRSTVSYALSHKRSISEETRSRILQAIEELGYKPNPTAIRLATGESSRAIGVVMPFTRPEIATLEVKFISGAAKVISQTDYSFILIDYTDHHPEVIERVVNSRLVDGLILLEVYQEDNRIPIVKKANIPFVLVGRCKDNTGMYFVDQDVYDGMRRIVRHFSQAGHRSAAFLHINDLEFSFVVNSLDGFYKACHEYGVTPITFPCKLSPEDGKRVMETILEQHPDVRASFIWSDIPGLGVIEAVQSRGLRIPQDFMIICQEHTILSNLPTFVASIEMIRAEELTANAARMLIDQLEGRPIPEPHLLIKPALMIKDQSLENETPGNFMFTGFQ